MADIQRKGDQQVQIVDQDTQDYAHVYSDNKLAVRTIISDDDHDLQLIAHAGYWRVPVDATVQVEEILGLDDYADTWFFVNVLGNDGDTIKVEIMNYGENPAPYISITTTKTASETTIDELALKVGQTLAADADFSAHFTAYVLWNIVFIRSRYVAERGEVPGITPDAVIITVTGAIEYWIPAGNEEIIRRKKVNLLTPDPVDPRYGILGVRGEVSSVIKAANPVSICIKRTLAASVPVLLIEEDVPAKQVWYIQVLLGSSQLGSEFEFWQGIERDRVESGLGDGTAYFDLDYGAVQLTSNPNQFIEYVKVNGVTRGTGTYTVADEDSTTPHHYEKSHIVFSAPYPTVSDTVEIKYDAMVRKMNMWCQKEGSQDFTFVAPMKISEYGFMVVLVENHSANAGKVSATLNGYYESTL